VGVESVEWIEGMSRATEGAAVVDEDGTVRDTPPEGALYVLFIQTDFGRNTARIRGQLKFRHYAENFIESLPPEDRVAVFSFDSHLKFRRDFTSDKESVRAAIRESVRIDHPPPPPVVHRPALGPLLDREAMRKAATSEAGLLLIADALRKIEGRKALILIGWGLGERVAGMILMDRKWPAAQRAFADARTPIFAIDTTEADYHDLAIGLSYGAESTGGFMSTSNVLPDQAITRLQDALAGAYELELRVPESLRRGGHRLDVRVKRRNVRVHAPAAVVAGS
jgi:VWFA-related protein